jgi:hypothetical protein
VPAMAAERVTIDRCGARRSRYRVKKAKLPDSRLPRGKDDPPSKLEEACQLIEAYAEFRREIIKRLGRRLIEARLRLLKREALAGLSGKRTSPRPTAAE